MCAPTAPGYLRGVVGHAAEWQLTRGKRGPWWVSSRYFTIEHAAIRATGEGRPDAAQAPCAERRRTARGPGQRTWPARAAAQRRRPRPDNGGRQAGPDVAGGLPVLRTARQERLRSGQARSPDRVAQAAAVGQGVAAARGHPVRRARRDTQG